ncbi:Helix-turn-helix domain protein [compost metagenome]
MERVMAEADAAFQVGYESPSHFSREYARMYGHPPIKDIRRFRDELQTGKASSKMSDA